MHDNNKNNGECMACLCPCDAHKEHNHEKSHNHDKDEDKGTCAACSCHCNDHEKHTCGC